MPPFWKRWKVVRNIDTEIFRGDLDQIRTVAEQSEPESEPKADAIRGTAAIIRRIDFARQRMEEEEARRIRAERLKDVLNVPLHDGEMAEWDGVRRRVSWSGSSRSGPGRRDPTHPPLGMFRMPDLENAVEGELKWRMEDAAEGELRRRRSIGVEEAMIRQIYDTDAAEKESHPHGARGRPTPSLQPARRRRSPSRSDPQPQHSSPVYINGSLVQLHVPTIPTSSHSPGGSESGLGLEIMDSTGVRKGHIPHPWDKKVEESDALTEHPVIQPDQHRQKCTAASMQNFDDYKLETDFYDGYVVHTTHKWKFSTRLWEKSTWRQKEKIGSGAFGSVWLQKNEEGEQLRAVKILLRDSLPRAGYSQELLSLVKLKDHERFFVKFLGWYENSDYIFLAMEYIEHGDLQNYMLKDPEEAKLDAKEITKQILRGLEILHKKEICHRDLKPPNILIASRNPIWVKIADFGVAKQTKNTAARTRWGTEGYSAPELLGALPRKLNTQRFPTALDIWSLGSLVHELLTSQLPFASMDEESGSETGVIVGSEGDIDMGSLVGYCRGDEFPIRALQQSHTSETGIDFIKNLLIPNPRHRPNATSVLQHPWLRGEDI